MSYKKLEDLEIAIAYKIIKVNRFVGMYGETTTLILDENSCMKLLHKIYLPKRYNRIKDLNSLVGMYLSYYGLNEIGEYKEHIIKISKFDGVYINGLYNK